MSEEMIIDEYFPSWVKLMIKANKEHLINHKNCIDDWVVIHWAEPDE